MAVAGRLVAKLDLDNRGFKGKIQQTTKSFTDLYFKAKTASMAIAGVGKAFNSALDVGGKFSAMQRANTIDISAAMKATKGYVGQMELMRQANTAAALGLDVNSQQFAKMSKAAVIAARAIGQDTNQAIEWLITGMGRQSKLMLDNIGIVVKADAAYEKMAKSLGVNVNQLTEADRKQAFMNASLEELDRIAGKANLQIENGADAWLAMKNNIGDVVNNIAVWIANAPAVRGAITSIGKAIAEIVESVGLLNQKGRREQILLQDTIQEYKRVRDAMMGKGTLGAMDYAKAQLRANQGGPKTVQEYNKAIADMEWKFTNNRIKRDLLANRKKLDAETAQLIAKIDREEKLYKNAEERKAAIRAEARKKGARGRLSKLRAQPGVGFGPDREELESGRDEQEMQEESKRKQKVFNTEMMKGRRRVDAMRESYRKYEESIRAANKATAEHNQHVSRQSAMLKGVGVNAVLDMAGGMWEAADAALASGESFGVAMLMMVKSTLMSISRVATVEAVKQTALALGAQGATWGVPNSSSTNHWASAATWAAIAIGAGATGLGIGAAMKGKGGGGGGSQGMGRGGMDRSSRSSYTPDSPRSQRKKEQQQINIKLYLGDPGDPGAALMMKKQLKAQLSN